MNALTLFFAPYFYGIYVQGIYLIKEIGHVYILEGMSSLSLSLKPTLALFITYLTPFQMDGKSQGQEADMWNALGMMHYSVYCIGTKTFRAIESNN